MVTPGKTRVEIAPRTLTNGSIVWEIVAFDSDYRGNFMVLATADTALEAMAAENAIFLAMRGR